MLVLSRRLNEQLLIGDSIVVTIVRVSCDEVRIGIQAPREMDIVRSELRESDEARGSCVDASC
jgi:carbon storage regulator